MSANADPGGWNILPPVTLPPSERLDHVRGCSEFAAHLLDRYPDWIEGLDAPGLPEVPVLTEALKAHGLEAGLRHMPLDLPFQNGPVRGKDVFIPLDALIGGVEMAGQGWRMLIECLSVGRAITLPATSTGGNKMIARATGAYARIRKQFNLPIGRFEGVEAGLARIAANTYATSALSRMTATAVDLGEKPAVPSAIAKYHTTEMARKTITDAMDIHGGKGVILGPRNYLGRAWEGIPVSITVEGANILTRNLMIFGQGAIRCHPFVLPEMQAASDEDEERGLIEEGEVDMIRRIFEFDDLVTRRVIDSAVSPDYAEPIEVLADAAGVNPSGRVMLRDLSALLVPRP